MERFAKQEKLLKEIGDKRDREIVRQRVAEAVQSRVFEHCMSLLGNEGIVRTSAEAIARAVPGFVLASESKDGDAVTHIDFAIDNTAYSLDLQEYYSDRTSVRRRPSPLDFDEAKWGSYAVTLQVNSQIVYRALCVVGDRYDGFLTFKWKPWWLQFVPTAVSRYSPGAWSPALPMIAKQVETVRLTLDREKTVSDQAEASRKLERKAAETKNRFGL